MHLRTVSLPWRYGGSSSFTSIKIYPIVIRPSRDYQFSHIRLSSCNIIWCVSIVSSPQCFIFSNNVWSSVHWCSLWILYAHWWIFLFTVSALSEATLTCGENSLSFFISWRGSVISFLVRFYLYCWIFRYTHRMSAYILYIKIFYPVDSWALSCHNYSPLVVWRLIFV